jgi:hypothetical protein
MFEKAELGLVLTDAARRKIQAKLNESSFGGKIPALMLQQKSPDTLTWRITYYDKESVAAADFKTLLLDVGGLELIVPQWNFADLIKGAKLDWTGSQFTVDGKTDLQVRRAP